MACSNGYNLTCVDDMFSKPLNTFFQMQFTIALIM